jgi:hypothetical protein
LIVSGELLFLSLRHRSPEHDAGGRVADAVRVQSFNENLKKFQFGYFLRFYYNYFQFSVFDWVFAILLILIKITINFLKNIFSFK